MLSVKFALWVGEMKLKVVSQIKNVFEGECKEVQLPTSSGLIGVLENHSPIVTILELGQIIVHMADGKKSIAINGGIAQVNENSVLVLANNAELSDDIIKDEIEKALENAEKQISGTQLPADLMRIEREIKYLKLKRKVVEA